MAPEYKRPPLPIPARLDGTIESSVSENVNIENTERLLSTEQFFVTAFASDGSLVRLVEQALTHNKDLKIAIVQVAQARALSRIDSSQRFPPIQAQVDAAVARNSLNLLIGQTSVTPVIPIENLANLNESLGWLAMLPSEVLLQRPDVMQAEEQLSAANADIGAARAAFFPSIRLSTSIGTASDNIGNLFDTGTRFWTFVPQITLPIFNYGRNSANFDLANLRNVAAVADYEKTVQSAFREVSDVLAARAALASRLNSERRLEAVEIDRVRLMKTRFEAGWEDRPRLLATRIRSAQARINSIYAQRDFALNRISIFHAFYGVDINRT